MLTMLESLKYSFRNPKKHNLSNLPHQTVEKLQKNHGVLRGPQLGKRRRRAMLGILRVKNTSFLIEFNTLILDACLKTCSQIFYKISCKKHINKRASILHVLPEINRLTLLHKPKSLVEVLRKQHRIIFRTELVNDFLIDNSNTLFSFANKSRLPRTQPKLVYKQWQ